MKSPGIDAARIDGDAARIDGDAAAALPLTHIVLETVKKALYIMIQDKHAGLLASLAQQQHHVGLAPGKRRDLSALGTLD